MLGLLLPLGACGTATIENAVPQSAAAGSLPTGPIDTGTYPNLNVAPVAATAQITPEQRAAREAELQAARSRASGTVVGPAAAAGVRLRQLPGSQQLVLEQIENE